MPEDRSGIDFHCHNTRNFMVFVVTVQYKDKWNLDSTETVPRQPRRRVGVMSASAKARKTRLGVGFFII